MTRVSNIFTYYNNTDTRRVSILVWGPISSKWNKKWNKFELRLDNFIPFFIPRGQPPKTKKNKQLHWNFLFQRAYLNVWVQKGKCLVYVP